MSSTAWERCPNCCRNTKQEPINMSKEKNFHHTLPYVKPRFYIWIMKRCGHCETEYESWYHLVFSKHIIGKKGKNAWEVPL